MISDIAARFGRDCAEKRLRACRRTARLHGHPDHPAGADTCGRRTGVGGRFLRP